MAEPILARCKKCGRGFVSVGTARPWRDAYYPKGTWPTKSNPDVEICGGEVELTRAGREALEKASAGEKG